tara:strand:+ start:926 stop:1381 length:456 start_codon:yes stop_codon:yes gene_type:complete
MVSVPEFEDDAARYAWEVGQRYERMDSMDRWLSSDDVYTIGPPIPPGAKVFTHEKATEAFKLATGSGYIAVRPVCEELGIGRIAVRRIFDRLSGLDVAYVVYPGKKAQSRYHCRVMHRRSVKLIKKDVPRWVMESKRGGKETTAKNIRGSG